MIPQFLQRILDVLLPKPLVERYTPETFLRATHSAQRANPEVAPGGALSPLAYRTALVREAIRALKFRGSPHAATLLAHALYPLLLDHVSETLLFAPGETVLLVPVPLSRRRERERGYSQSRLLAEALVELAHIPELALAPDVLVRNKDTKPQTKTRSRKERLENVRGCFSVPDGGRVRGRHIILVDDVTTTGATLGEAHSALLTAGAASVLSLAAAH